MRYSTVFFTRFSLIEWILGFALPYLLHILLLIARFACIVLSRLDLRSG